MKRGYARVFDGTGKRLDDGHSELDLPTKVKRTVKRTKAEFKAAWEAAKTPDERRRLMQETIPVVDDEAETT
jgi:hypothetical protein